MVWVEVALAPLVAMFKTFWVFPVAAVEVEARENKEPEDKEVEEAVRPVPVVKELKVQVEVLAPIAKVWLPLGSVMEFHLTPRAAGSVQVMAEAPPPAEVRT